MRFSVFSLLLLPSLVASTEHGIPAPHLFYQTPEHGDPVQYAGDGGQPHFGIVVGSRQHSGQYLTVSPSKYPVVRENIDVQHTVSVHPGNVVRAQRTKKTLILADSLEIYHNHFPPIRQAVDNILHGSPNHIAFGLDIPVTPVHRKQKERE